VPRNREAQRLLSGWIFRDPNRNQDHKAEGGQEGDGNCYRQGDHWDLSLETLGPAYSSDLPKLKKFRQFRSPPAAIWLLHRSAPMAIRPSCSPHPNDEMLTG
jgi:hypothetical protein